MLPLPWPRRREPARELCVVDARGIRAPHARPPVSSPEHAHRGIGKLAPALDPCTKCGLIASRHRSRQRKRSQYFRAYRAAGKGQHGPRRIIAIDGEGYTTKDGRHLYTYLAACDSTSLISDVSNPEGLTFEEVAAFLLDLPKGALVVGYSLGYDRTKWFESLPDRALWSLMHPDKRPGKFGPRPVKLRTGLDVNVISTLTRIKRTEDRARVAVWDLFKFFQCSFVKALRAWGIGTEEQVTRIERMKQKRGSFKGIGKQEENYCQLECMMLADLAESLFRACEKVDLKLGDYYGPGSLANVLLKKCNARRERAAIPTEAHAHAFQCAYTGGRFEVSRVGPVLAVKGRLYKYDIASAYPYAIALLPCMRRTHGYWQHVTEPAVLARLGEHNVACIRFRVDAHPEASTAWGPLPHRTPKSDLIFPVVSAGSWGWAPEVFAGKALHPGVTLLEAYVWMRTCKCPAPFKRNVVRYFKVRLAWGKGGKGIVAKLALNSIYGKSAQGVGRPKYRCIVRAGLITSMCRAMLLRALACAKDLWNVVDVATDSLLSTEPLKLPEPVELGTRKAAKKAGKATLGQWEAQPWEGGAFLLRPGLRFATDLRPDPKCPEHGKTKAKGACSCMAGTAARGVGVRILHANRKAILRAWKRAPMAPYQVTMQPTFHGATSSVRRVGVPPHYEYRRAENYGTWSENERRTLRYEPTPKRSAITQGPKGAIRLVPFELPQTDDARSLPYGGESELGKLLEELRELEDEQPQREMLGIV
jgi:hypothetical protein